MEHKFITSILCFFLLGWSSHLKAQDTVFRKLSMPELFVLAEKSQQMKISRTYIKLASQRKAVTETAKLPSLSTGLTYTYIGDATILERDFSKSTNVKMPHFGNTFSVQASQLVFKGGLVNNNIEKAALDQQIAELSFEKNAEDIKMLLVGHYLDLYKLYNQRETFKRNIALTQMRLTNISKMHREGMVTKNDLVRTELQLSNLDLAVQEINNNISIINTRLTTITGLPQNNMIVPDSSILSEIRARVDYNSSLNYAFQNHPDLKIAGVQSQVAEKNLQIAKTEKLPSISLIAGNDLSRPITTSSPVMDMYANGWYAGVSINFNISSLYNSKKSINLAKTAVVQQQQITDLQRQNVELEVNAAFTKHNEAIQRIATLEKSVNLANENFRIVDAKYFNGMALITDLLDASNAKLDAELQMANAQINIIYTWYQLQRSMGNLN